VPSLFFESRLAAPADTVWAAVSTMDGVNDELMPLMRMSHPADLARFDDDVDVRPGLVVFHSWLLLFGVLPIDRHALAFDRLIPGRGFDERSHSWLQREWIHRRRVEPIGPDACRVRDELAFEPRVPSAAPLVKPVVRRLFTHRHRRLRARFGVAPA
jgi:ligand-binding SRPBCC domain-containing protein